MKYAVELEEYKLGKGYQVGTLIKVTNVDYLKLKMDNGHVIITNKKNCKQV